MKYFGTDGIRGVWGETLFEEFAKIVGYAYGLALREDRDISVVFQNSDTRPCLLVGRDTRMSGPEIASAIMSGAILAGFDVLDAGVITTPAHNYLTKSGNFVGGVMITASHNPTTHNGIKLCNFEGKKYSLDFLQKVEEYIDVGIPSKPSQSNLGRRFTDFTLGERWIDFILSKLGNPDFSGITVALDLANGAGFSLIPEAFSRTGATVLSFNTESDGRNINNCCGSLNVDRFASIVVKCGADIGFSFDGDADRIVVVDSLGRVVDGADLMYIFGVYYAKLGKLTKNAVVSTPITNLGLEASLKTRGIMLVRTQEVGGQYIHSLMDKNGYVIGGEENGHMLLGDIGEGSDGMCIGLYLIKILREEKCKLSDLLVGFCRTKTAQNNIAVTLTQKQKVSQGILAPILTEQSLKLGDSGRIIVRPSGTECVIRVLVEGENRELLDEICKTISDYIKKLD